MKFIIRYLVIGLIYILCVSELHSQSFRIEKSIDLTDISYNENASEIKFINNFTCILNGAGNSLIVFDSTFKGIKIDLDGIIYDFNFIESKKEFIVASYDSESKGLLTIYNENFVQIGLINFDEAITRVVILNSNFVLFGQNEIYVYSLEDFKKLQTIKTNESKVWAADAIDQNSILFADNSGNLLMAKKGKIESLYDGDPLQSFMKIKNFNGNYYALNKKYLLQINYDGQILQKILIEEPAFDFFYDSISEVIHLVTSNGKMFNVQIDKFSYNSQRLYTTEAQQDVTNEVNSSELSSINFLNSEQKEHKYNINSIAINLELLNQDYLICGTEEGRIYSFDTTLNIISDTIYRESPILGITALSKYGSFVTWQSNGDVVQWRGPKFAPGSKILTGRPVIFATSFDDKNIVVNNWIQIDSNNYKNILTKYGITYPGNKADFKNDIEASKILDTVLYINQFTVLSDDRYLLLDVNGAISEFNSNFGPVTPIIEDRLIKYNYNQKTQTIYALTEEGHLIKTKIRIKDKISEVIRLDQIIDFRVSELGNYMAILTSTEIYLFDLNKNIVVSKIYVPVDRFVDEFEVSDSGYLFTLNSNSLKNKSYSSQTNFNHGHYIFDMFYDDKSNKLYILLDKNKLDVWNVNY